MSNLTKGYRIQSLDLLRGLVMVIMALDHVRDFFHAGAQEYDPLDFERTDYWIFLTRWITHSCAPVFVFLAGTSACLTAARKGKRTLSKFLLTRGLWLIILEVLVINFAWSFDWTYSFIGLQTIWALGIGMIALSVLIYLPRRVLLVVALLIIAGHNLLDNIHLPGKDLAALGWSMLHEPGFFNYPPFTLLVLYPVLPWIGLMAAGYCFGELYTDLNAEKRKRMLIMIGSACVILFILIRFSNFYGDASKWSEKSDTAFTILSFINTTKYPPSLLYILMTIGPAILFLAFTEKPLKKFGNIIATYGKVPMFYYILHFFFIHIAAGIAGLLTGFSWQQFTSAPGFWKGYGFSLFVVYIVWIVIVAILYPLCKKYAMYKQAHPEKWWLSYL